MSDVTELLRIPHQGYRCKQMADGSWQTLFYHPELSPQDVATMVAGSRLPGYLVAKPNFISDEDIPTEDAPVESGMKTPGQRLRSVLYIYWREETNKTEDFNTQFYPRVMNELTEKYKEKIQ